MRGFSFISVSVGSKALPEVLEALAHAKEAPDHDPIITFLPVDDDGENVEQSQRVKWRCAQPGCPHADLIADL